MANEQNKQPQKGDKKPRPTGNLYWIYGIILLFILISFFFLPDRNKGQERTSNEVEELVRKGEVDRIVVISNERKAEVYLKEQKTEDDQKSPALFTANAPDVFYTFGDLGETQKQLNVWNEKYQFDDWKFEERTDWFGPILQILLPIGILVAIWIFFMRRMGGGMGGSQIFNVGKSKALLHDKENRPQVTFKDVAGLDEAKQEVVEVVDFLKHAGKYKKLGGHIPKGVLLVGPPGTGKTLLAKAVAGEAGVPFFSLSGSDFVEMFVGVGAARVRDLFKQAKEKAPCIIFIDEIDAIGRTRGRSSMTGGNDERENTLNQLLVEMDGFGSDTGVIIIAATNRADVLDQALQRPGRFDRTIAVDRPDLREREAIFKVHLTNIKLAGEVNAATLATQTPGMVGADIMNVCNEAALIAARKNKEAVDMQDFQDAIDRSIGGLEKKNKIISPEEKKIIAYHEAGHAVVGWFAKHADPLVKVSIIPRGVAALGYAQYLPKDQYLYTNAQLKDRMMMTLGGRAAEEIVFGEISTGAQNDLERITQMAYSMVAIYGMTKAVGNVSYRDNSNEMSFTKPYSEDLARQIDDQARGIIQKAYNDTLTLLRERSEELERLAQALLEKEVIMQDDLIDLIGERPGGIPQQQLKPSSEETLGGNGAAENPTTGEEKEAGPDSDTPEADASTSEV